MKKQRDALDTYLEDNPLGVAERCPEAVLTAGSYAPRTRDGGP